MVDEQNPKNANEWLLLNAQLSAPLTPPFRGSQGVGSVSVREIASSDRATHRVLPGGASVSMGVPLRVVREALGGDVGVMEHPDTGEPMTIDVRGWKNADPDTTLIQIEFRFKPQR